MTEPLIPVVKETHLSRRPAPRSGRVALGSVAVLFACSLVYWTDPGGVGSLLPASGEAVFEKGEYWRLFTSMAAHGDLEHFLANGIVFGVLSFLLYGYFGAFIYPVLSLGLGALVTGLSLSTYPPRVTLVGASGLVYWMAGFWLTLYLCIERRLSPGKRLFRAAGFTLIVLLPAAWDPAVSHRTHGIGFGAGVLSGLVYFLREKEGLRSSERTEWE